MSLELRLLGPLSVFVDGQDATPTPPKQRALLALLALRADEVVASDDLVEALWAGRPPATADTGIRVYVRALRRALGAAAIETHPPGYRLRITPGETDRGRFEALVEAAGREPGPARHAELLRHALDLFRGEPLADFRYEAFARAEINRLEEMRLLASADLAEAELELGRHRELVPELEQLVDAHPLRERLRGQLMIALYRSGRQADALEVYRAGRRILVEELGLEPGPELRALEQRILEQDPGLAPPPAAAAAATRATGNLPAQATSFVGRERELAELRSLLAGHRLLTLHGAGGSGKTRLALRAAGELAHDYEHGAWLVELAPVDDPAQVWPTIATALGVPEEPDRPPADLVISALAGSRRLLVLDNCEHLLGAARDAAASLIAGCPGLRLLATSREPLGDPAEIVWPIPELSSPGEGEQGPEALLAHDAVRLFAERGARALHGYRPGEREVRAAARICRRLDGMPLAIELAAARLNVLSTEQIEERLADRFRLLTRGASAAPARHRTLRATVDWSYELLSGAEQAALAQCSVFVGGFDIDAAEHVIVVDDLTDDDVTDDDVTDDDVLDLVGGLVAKSLVARHDEHARARYGLHETIREYAAERLADSQPDRVARRHLDWYLDLMSRGDEEMRGPEQRAWGERLALDQDNFRRALAWGVSHGAAQEALDLAWHLHMLWAPLGNFEESERWLGETLARTRGAPPSVERTRALSRWGAIAERKGDYTEARARYEDALAMARALGNAVREGVALLSLGDVDLAQGRLDDARAHFEASDAAMRKGGDRERARWPVDALGRCALAAGDPSEARRHLEHSRAEARALGNESGVGEAALWLGAVAHHEGDLVAARGLYEEGLGTARRLGDRVTEAECLTAIGRLAIDAGATADAAAPLAEALVTFFEAGLRPVVPPCLELLAAVALEADAKTATRLLGAASAFRETMGTWIGGRDRARVERIRAAARDAQGEQAFTIASGAGRAMGWREAVELALRSARR
jgi:predicted ATPase/DNA-binding SARP family transcriptional activator